MNYQPEIDRERAKIKLLRDKAAFITAEIQDSERMIALLEKRASKNGGDAFDKFLDEHVAGNAVLASETAHSPAPDQQTPAPQQTIYEFPKVRSDSIWPYVIRFMEAKDKWRVEELMAFAKQAGLVKTESAIRSALSSLKSWDFLENDTPGYFSLKPKSFAYLSTLKRDQFVLGDATGTTYSENNV